MCPAVRGTGVRMLISDCCSVGAVVVVELAEDASKSVAAVPPAEYEGIAEDPEQSADGDHRGDVVGAEQCGVVMRACQRLALSDDRHGARSGVSRHGVLQDEIATGPTAPWESVVLRLEDAR